MHHLKSLFSNLTKPSILLITLSLLLSSQIVKAETPTYKIEVIVFENMSLKGWTEEYWPEDIELPVTSQSTSVYNQNKKPLWIRSSSQELGNHAAKMRRNGYRVIFHEAWTQLAYPNKKSHKVLIEGSNNYGSNLLGTVRLYKTRYAHVDFDLELERRIPAKVLETFVQNQKLSTHDTLPAHWRFNLKESRKIRPGELHYLDHPIFGALVQITPLK